MINPISYMAPLETLEVRCTLTDEQITNFYGSLVLGHDFNDWYIWIFFGLSFLCLLGAVHWYKKLKVTKPKDPTSTGLIEYRDIYGEIIVEDIHT